MRFSKSSSRVFSKSTAFCSGASGTPLQRHAKRVWPFCKLLLQGASAMEGEIDIHGAQAYALMRAMGAVACMAAQTLSPCLHWWSGEIWLLHMDDSCICLQHSWPPWPNGQGVGPLIRRLWVRVPQGVFARSEYYCVRMIRRSKY